MDYTPIYYTYSTIAQTLATACGLTIAVTAIRQPTAVSKLMKMLRARDAEFAKIAGLPPNEKAAREELLQMERKAVESEYFKFTTDLSYSVTLTVWTIGACLILMPLTNAGTPLGDPRAAWLFLVLTVIAAICCLRMYYPVLVKTGDPGD